MKRVAIYARVSSDRQDIDLSISAQLKALREHALRNGLEVVREYVDEAESGRSIDRPGFKEMIVVAKQKPPPFETILVWKLSRFARNREDSIIYKSLLRKHGIQVVSINEPVEDTPSGRLLEGIIEVIDEFYSASLAQDVVRGQRENASRGFRNGGRPPYGYNRVQVPDGSELRARLEPDLQTAPVVQRIFRECLSGKGLKPIARSLNADGLTTRAGKNWGATSLEKILRNEAYTGTMVWDRRRKRLGEVAEAPAPVRVEGAWPALVDRDTFAQAQAMLAARAPRVVHPKVVDSPYLLNGLIRCGRCGAAMVGQGGDQRYQYYMCGAARRKGREVCQARALSKERIERFVVDRVKEYILTEENLEELVRLTNEELAQTCHQARERLKLLEAQAHDLECRLGKLYEALETGQFRTEELSPRIRTLLQKKGEILRAKAEAEEALCYHTIQLADPQVVREYVQDLKALLEESTIVERKGFLKSFVERIEVADSEVKVVYALPLPPHGATSETAGVLPFIHLGKGRGGVNKILGGHPQAPARGALPLWTPVAKYSQVMLREAIWNGS